MGNKFIKLFPILILIIVAAGAAFYIFKKNEAGKPVVSNYNSSTPDEIKADKVLLNVPFTSQAPLGHWSDPRQEDGCEEASLLMAWLWIKNQTLTPTQAEKAITDISDFELQRYGNFHDFDAEDTAKLMTDYYHYDKHMVTINPTIEDIKNALRNEKLVLVPANGQKLNNPHYTAPGPTTHMLVIKGFDDSKNQFITNDSGTKFGESYVYNYQTLYNAIVNYPTGDHESQAGRPKAMIAIQK